MSPTSAPVDGSTTSSFSMRCLCSSARASSAFTVGGTVTRRSRGVIVAPTVWSRFVSKRMSRDVRIPTGRPSTTTGSPEMS